MSIRPEIEVLLQCLRPSPTPEQVVDRLRRLGPDVDWPWLLDMAERHRVLPLVQRTLTTLYAEWLPTDVVERLEGYAVAIALRNAHMTRELLAVLEEFERAHIAVIPFKGPVLAMLVYGEVGLRDFRDLDLLIRAPQVQAAVDVLVRRGYRLDPPLDARQAAFVSRLRGDRRTAYLRSRSEHHFVRSSDNLTIDLHLALSDPYIRFPLNAAALFARGDRMTLGARSVVTLSAEDTLLMLALNGAKDGWSQLQRTCDVAALLQARTDLDARRVLRRARRLGVERMLRVSLLLAHGLLGVQVPALPGRDAGTDPASAALASDVERSLFSARERHPALSLAYSRFYVRTRERLRDRLWYYAWLAFTPGVADWQLVSLPPRLSGLYYVLRPGRLAVTYGLARLSPR